MARDVISAKLDIIFKKLFIENEDLLHSFVASMLDIPAERIRSIQITNPELPPETVEGKFSRLDLSLQVDDKLVNVEIQMKNYEDFRDRTLFYWAKLYSSELKSGESYLNLKQTVTINIVNFNMFEGGDYHTEVAAVIKGTGEVFSDKFSMHFFELKKIGKVPNPADRKELWLQFINADKEEEFEMIHQTNVPIMQKAVQVIYDMSEDTRVREIARLREKAMHDEASLMHTARSEGKAEGLAEGLAEGKAKGLAEGLAEGKAKGLAEGLAEGKAKGLAEGLAEGRNEIIAKMRAAGMTEEEIERIIG